MMKFDFSTAAKSALGGALFLGTVASARANDLYYAPSMDAPVKAWPADGFEHIKQNHVVVYDPSTQKIYKFTMQVPNGSEPAVQPKDLKLVGKGLDQTKFVYLEDTTGKLPIDLTRLASRMSPGQFGKFTKAYKGYYGIQSLRKPQNGKPLSIPNVPDCKFGEPWDPFASHECRRSAYNVTLIHKSLA